MALGNVIVNAIDQQQGTVASIEKYFLFIGTCSVNQDVLLTVDVSSDLDGLLGAEDSVLKSQVSAARANAGQSWAAAVLPLANPVSWGAAVDQAMAVGLMVEAIVVCDPTPVGEEFVLMQTKAMEILAEHGRRLFFITGVAGLDGNEIWPDYLNALGNLTDGIAADRVCVVPYIFDDAVGVYAGRLCNDQVSVADTPMRVATGPIVGHSQQDLPLDDGGFRYTNAHAKPLNDFRYSVPALHADVPGVFWSDGQTLDAVTGDFSVIENLRVMDKAARAVRLVLIGLLGNRSFNSSPAGSAWAKEMLSKPLREMSRSVVFNGLPLPAEIKKPRDEDVLIQWVSNEEVQVFISLTPFNIPKKMTASILLNRAEV